LLKRETGWNIYGVLEKLTLPKCVMLLQSYTRKDLIDLDMKAKELMLFDLVKRKKDGKVMTVVELRYA
jgi:hypothetical protein